jgi:hypothetical protein
MFSGCNLRRQTHEQESQGKKADAATSAHGNRSRARTASAVCDQTGDLRASNGRLAIMKHEQRTEDSRFRTRLRRAKEVRSVQSRFVWINRGLAWMSIWRGIVSPELTKRCGVSAGMTTIPPAFTSRCSSPTVMVAQLSSVNATSTHGCLCKGGPCPGCPVPQEAASL